MLREVWLFCGGIIVSFYYKALKGGFVGLKTIWKGATYNFVNVYVSCNIAGRLAVWSKLLRLRRLSMGKEWFIAQDFNSVMFKEEGIGRGVESRGKEREDFGCFIEDMKLVDLPCVGEIYLV